MSETFDAPPYEFLSIRKIRSMTIYHLVFESMLEIERFLEKNPPINTESFSMMMSAKADEDFAGPPLPQAIAYCSGGYQEGLKNFMQMSRQMEAITWQSYRQRTAAPAIVGSRPNVPAYIAGEPKSMYRLSRSVEKKVIKMFMNLSYNRNTTEGQILVRGVLTLNLIQLLEQNGYIVDFRAVTASTEKNETFICEIRMKKPGAKIDIGKVFYPMCGKSFLRRVISRLKESMPFEQEWGSTYGKVANQDFLRAVLNIDKSSLFIGTPQEMGIIGKNILEDADAFLGTLNLGNRIAVPKYNVSKEN